MGDAIEARIRPHHYDGDVAVVHIEFPGGAPASGGGGGAEHMLYSGYSVHPDVLPNVTTDVPFGNSSLSLVEGFSVEAGDLQIPATSGAYLTKMNLNLSYEEDPPSSGFANIHVDFVTPDPGIEDILLVGIEVSTLHDSDGYGDYGFTDFGMQKMTFDIAPADGYIVFRADQNTDIPLVLGATRLIIAKL